MEPDNNSLISRATARADGLATQATEGLARAGANAGIIEKFQALPKAGQVGVGLGAVALLWLLFGGSSTPTTTQGNPNLGMVGGQVVSPTSSFQALETDRPALMQNVQEQNRREMAELRTKVEEQFTQRDTALQSALEQNQQLQQQMQQMMSDFSAEIKNMQDAREQDAARMAQLADQQKQMELGAPVGDATAPNGFNGGPNLTRRQPIRQTSLGPPPQGTGGGRALLAPLTSGLGSAANNLRNQAQAQETARTPFIPPLGFVEATLLNGVDALVGGQATPALARISGNYTTAMNTTVSLDGCIVMVEFNGNIATERAIGKPARMTCVYPDGGAATYDLSGYVVDAEDGVIGVPGLLYEGDPTRIAASIMADFLAGVGSIVAQNQTTTQTSTQTGVATRTITGDQTRAELAGGVDKAFSSIRDYLKERVDRTTPFIRLDALRTVNLVILNGQELRSGPNGAGAWTLLFDSQASAAAAAPAASPQSAGGPQ